MNSTYRPLQTLSGILVFTQMISIFLMMTVVGTAAAAFGVRTVLDSYAEAEPSLALTADQSATLASKLVSPLNGIVELSTACWRVGMIATTISLLVLVIWTFRAHRNLTPLGVRGIKHHSGLTLLYWFLPFLNMVLPHLALREVWYGSDPSGLTMRRKSALSTPRFVGMHWIGFLFGYSWYPTVILVALLAGVVGFDAMGWFESYMDAGGWQHIYTWAIIASVAIVFMNYVGIFLVERITQMQTDRHRLFTARGGEQP